MRRRSVSQSHPPGSPHGSTSVVRAAVASRSSRCVGAPASTAFGATTVDERRRPVPLDSPTGSYIVVLDESPAASYEGGVAGLAATMPEDGREARPALPRASRSTPRSSRSARARSPPRRRSNPRRPTRSPSTGSARRCPRRRRRSVAATDGVRRRLSRRDLPSRRRAVDRLPRSRGRRRRVGIARRSGCRRHRRRGRCHRHRDRAREPVLRRGAAAGRSEVPSRTSSETRSSSRRPTAVSSAAPASRRRLERRRITRRSSSARSISRRGPSTRASPSTHDVLSPLDSDGHGSHVGEHRRRQRGVAATVDGVDFGPSRVSRRRRRSPRTRPASSGADPLVTTDDTAWAATSSPRSNTPSLTESTSSTTRSVAAPRLRVGRRRHRVLQRGGRRRLHRGERRQRRSRRIDRRRSAGALVHHRRGIHRPRRSRPPSSCRRDSQAAGVSVSVPAGARSARLSSTRATRDWPERPTPASATSERSTRREVAGQDRGLRSRHQPARGEVAGGRGRRRRRDDPGERDAGLARQRPPRRADRAHRRRRTERRCWPSLRPPGARRPWSARTSPATHVADAADRRVLEPRTDARRAARHPHAGCRGSWRRDPRRQAGHVDRRADVGHSLGHLDGGSACGGAGRPVPRSASGSDARRDQVGDHDDGVRHRASADGSADVDPFAQGAGHIDRGALPRSRAAVPERPGRMGWFPAGARARGIRCAARSRGGPQPRVDRGRHSRPGADRDPHAHGHAARYLPVAASIPGVDVHGESVDADVRRARETRSEFAVTFTNARPRSRCGRPASSPGRRRTARRCGLRWPCARRPSMPPLWSPPTGSRAAPRCRSSRG